MLLGVARVLVQRTEVPEQTHVGTVGTEGEVLLNDLANDRQVEPVRVGMTLRIRFPAPQNSSLIFSGRRMCALVFRTCLHRDGNVSSFNRLRCENRPERFVAEMKDTCREMSNGCVGLYFRSLGYPESLVVCFCHSL